MKRSSLHMSQEPHASICWHKTCPAVMFTLPAANLILACKQLWLIASLHNCHLHSHLAVGLLCLQNFHFFSLQDWAQARRRKSCDFNRLFNKILAKNHVSIAQLDYIFRSCKSILGLHKRCAYKLFPAMDVFYKEKIYYWIFLWNV